MKDGNSDKMLRIGNGYDVHVLTEGRKLVLGGVEIPHTKGVLGHSDGDVLVHAIMDAMLGALALGDIGQHFPDTDMQYKNIDSMLLLSKVKELIYSKGYKIINLDSIIVLQKPKVKPYIEAMRKRIAEVLEIEVDQVSVKATTEEKLGFTGDESGVKSYCVVLLEK
jgi:2-C-methyl-D-erythritol 2,4-cyclodiphosphate synthase